MAASLTLKDYQRETLDALRRFLEEARVAGPQAAFKAAIEETNARALETGGRVRAVPPYVPLQGLPGVPYACLRLPTGGGKTLLAAHAVKIARDAWIERDNPLVLWLVPSNTIRAQTVDALKKPDHPYRAALDAAFGGRVRVFDITDFRTLRPADLARNACLVVGTIQTLRTTSTDGRKVYAHDENLEPHFSNVSKTTPGLEPVDADDPSKGPRFSFANLMHLHRPLMIVDEAHGAVTGLTREMQVRVNPCAIVELTATPRDEKGRPLNNILHSVSAQALKDAEMIKLPIVLQEHEGWENAVNGAVARRAQLAELAELAEKDRTYIRPIVLFQAQKKAKGEDRVTAEVLRQHLIDTEQVDPKAIAIATGDQRDLDGIDLFRPDCPIEHVITVEALKEGWDCSFAYVFCSVSRIRSATDVEQLLGRVLRMPFAERRREEMLNRAYAHLSEPEFGAAARALTDRLVDRGFDEDEARDNVEPAQASLGGDGPFGAPSRPRPFRHRVNVHPDQLDALKGDGLDIVPTEDGAEIVAPAGLDEATAERIRTALPRKVRAAFEEASSAYRAQRPRPSPAERGEVLRVPALMAKVQGELELAETERLLEHHDWSLLDHSPRLDEQAFSIRETDRAFEIDVDGRTVRYQVADAEQTAMNVDVDGWTDDALAVWLDRQVRALDLHPSELLRWLRDLVGHLTGPRGLRVDALMRAKFLLARRVRERLDGIRDEVRRRVYQGSLFDEGARPSVSFDHAFVFRHGMYDGQRLHRGSWRPTKHFLGPDAVPAFDGAMHGEEEACAVALDSLPQVRHWVRNVPRHPASFWLPRAGGRFYPDFVAELDDGRSLVVEYKGADRADNPDTNEKRLVGDLWARSSEGRGLFLMALKDDGGRDVRRQLEDVIAGER